MIRSRIRIRVHLSKGRIRRSASASGSLPKCHGSGTLIPTVPILAHADLGCGEPACRVGDEEAANDVPRVLADPPVLGDGELSRLDLVEQLLKQSMSFALLAPDESIPTGRRVKDTSRHNRGRPLSCWCYIVAFHPWLEITWYCSAIMQFTVLFLSLALAHHFPSN